MELSSPAEKRRRLVNRDRRRTRAIAAARAIASEGGYEAISMHEVARRSGVSRATLYRYFSSKDHLLVEVSLEFSAELLREIEGGQALNGSPAERVAYPFVRMLEAIAREPKLFGATLRAYFAEDPAIRPLVVDLRHFGALYVNAALGSEIHRYPELARVLDPLSLAMAIRISSGRSTLAEAVREFRAAVRVLLRE